MRRHNVDVSLNLACLYKSILHVYRSKTLPTEFRRSQDDAHLDQREHGAVAAHVSFHLFFIYLRRNEIFKDKRAIFLDVHLMYSLAADNFGTRCYTGNEDDVGCTLEAEFFFVVGVGRSVRRESLDFVQHEGLVNDLQNHLLKYRRKIRRNRAHGRYVGYGERAEAPRLGIKIELSGVAVIVANEVLATLLNV